MINKNLENCTFRLHWIIFVYPLLVLLLATVLASYFKWLQGPVLIMAIFLGLWLIAVWTNYCFASLTVTAQKIVIKNGIIVRQTLDVPLNKIETIDIRQSILGTLLGYGTVYISGTGGAQMFIKSLSNPLTCRRYIEQLMPS